ncbi:hypothetical protein [Deinococcus aquaedulcis]|uniref:hypothetical protein n=1 Tax=Deinococcus aquaedulcis TaxID=2840455 RepID=UPI001C82885C|nr:hypothetical protein [Deinococcus aquaedulcis]
MSPFAHFPARRRLLPLLLGLSAAASAAAPITPSGPTSLSGTVKQLSEDTDTGFVPVPWQGGAGQVEARVASSAGTSRVIVSAPLGAGGQFSLKLPAVLDASLLPPAGQSPLPAAWAAPHPAAKCTGTVGSSEPGARVVQLALSVQARTSGVVMPVLSSGHYDEAQATGHSRTQHGLVYYADRPVRFSGTQVCQWTQSGYLNKMTLVASVQLAQGWNRLTMDTTALSTQSGVDTTFRLTSGALPTNDWTLMPDAELP